MLGIIMMALGTEFRAAPYALVKVQLEVDYMSVAHQTPATTISLLMEQEFLTII
jgi:hypothetical protein